MSTRKVKALRTFPLLLALLVVVSACNLGPAQPASGTTNGNSGAGGASGSAGGTASVTHAQVPAEPPAAVNVIKDPIDSSLAAQHRVNSGEDFAFNQFERPFSQDMQTYAPQLDIQQASYSKDNTWVYISIQLVGPDPKNGGLSGVYGVELDVNRDGRGDFLVVVTAPKATSWSSDGVKVYADTNQDVGGIHPVQADTPPQTGDGYETLLYDSGQGKDPDLAFARISPSDANTVQLAFKWTMTNSSPFMWGVWSFDPSMFHPGWFDYDDHFTQADSGSPVLELKQFYPLKDLYLLDNTCRWGSGFTPSTHDLGACPLPATPTPAPGHPSGPTPTWTQEPPR